MKSFKTFIDEAIKRSFGFSAGVGSDTFQKPAEDSVKNMSDLADPEILKRVNSFVSAIADAEYIQPMAAVEQLRSKLEALGLSFGDVQMEGKSGSVSLDVIRFGGRYGEDGSGEIINDDGISHQKSGGLKLKLRYETLENGACKVYAELK